MSVSVCLSVSDHIFADRQTHTHTQTDMLITILPPLHPFTRVRSARLQCPLTLPITRRHFVKIISTYAVAKPWFEVG